MTNGVATLGDVAERAGVSKSTVSRVLAAKRGQRIPFSITTQEKVRDAANALGYRPSKLARGLTKSRTGIIGLVVPSIKNSFFPNLIDAIESRLTEEGFNVILADTNADPLVERAKIEDLLSWRVDGLIIAPCQKNPDVGIFQDLKQKKVPFVLVDRNFPQTPFYSVVSDDYSGAVMMTEHLLSLGYRRIAVVSDSFTISTHRLRYAGYTDTLIRYGITPDPALSIQADATSEGGSEAMRSIMELPGLPDAVFFFGDPMVIGAMNECFSHGIKVPEDIAMAGYADLNYASVLRAPLTTVRQPRGLLGKFAVEILIAQLNGHNPGQFQLKLPVELVIRESCGANSEIPRRML
ncbi:MAG: LacI family DNA-binding transcriptional regulator [Armatimonadota bacterium]